MADVEDVTSACMACVPLTWYNTGPRMESSKKVSLLYEESEKINNQKIPEYQQNLECSKSDDKKDSTMERFHFGNVLQPDQNER